MIDLLLRAGSGGAPDSSSGSAVNAMASSGAAVRGRLLGNARTVPRSESALAGAIMGSCSPCSGLKSMSTSLIPRVSRHGGPISA